MYPPRDQCNNSDLDAITGYKWIEYENKLLRSDILETACKISDWFDIYLESTEVDNYINVEKYKDDILTIFVFRKEDNIKVFSFKTNHNENLEIDQTSGSKIFIKIPVCIESDFTEEENVCTKHCTIDGDTDTPDHPMINYRFNKDGQCYYIPNDKMIFDKSEGIISSGDVVSAVCNTRHKNQGTSDDEIEMGPRECGICGKLNFTATDKCLGECTSYDENDNPTFIPYTTFILDRDERCYFEDGVDTSTDPVSYTEDPVVIDPNDIVTGVCHLKPKGTTEMTIELGENRCPAPCNKEDFVISTKHANNECKGGPGFFSACRGIDDDGHLKIPSKIYEYTGDTDCTYETYNYENFSKRWIYETDSNGNNIEPKKIRKVLITGLGVRDNPLVLGVCNDRESSGEGTSTDQAANDEMEEVECLVHCEGSLGKASECSSYCGAGTIDQIYTVTQEAKFGGEECPYEDNEVVTRPCNNAPCIDTPECGGSWTEYIPCSIINGNCVKTQKFVIPESNEFGACRDPDTGVTIKNGDSKFINCTNNECATDCVLGTTFTDWQCESSCWDVNSGQPAPYKKRTRSGDVQPTFGGKACPPVEEIHSSDKCDIPCDRQECVETIVSDWSTCSKSCTEHDDNGPIENYGVQYKQVSYVEKDPRATGQNCGNKYGKSAGTYTLYRECNPDPCPETIACKGYEVETPCSLNCATEDDSGYYQKIWKECNANDPSKPSYCDGYTGIRIANNRRRKYNYRYITKGDTNWNSLIKQKGVSVQEQIEITSEKAEYVNDILDVRTTGEGGCDGKYDNTGQIIQNPIQFGCAPTTGPSCNENCDLYFGSHVDVNTPPSTSLNLHNYRARQIKLLWNPADFPNGSTQESQIYSFHYFTTGNSITESSLNSTFSEQATSYNLNTKRFETNTYSAKISKSDNVNLPNKGIDFGENSNSYIHIYWMNGQTFGYTDLYLNSNVLRYIWTVVMMAYGGDSSTTVFFRLKPTSLEIKLNLKIWDDNDFNTELRDLEAKETWCTIPASFISSTKP